MPSTPQRPQTHQASCLDQAPPTPTPPIMFQPTPTRAHAQASPAARILSAQPDLLQRQQQPAASCLVHASQGCSPTHVAGSGMVLGAPAQTDTAHSPLSGALGALGGLHTSGSCSGSGPAPIFHTVPMRRNPDVPARLQPVRADCHGAQAAANVAAEPAACHASSPEPQAGCCGTGSVLSAAQRSKLSGETRRAQRHNSEASAPDASISLATLRRKRERERSQSTDRAAAVWPQRALRLAQPARPNQPLTEQAERTGTQAEARTQAQERSPAPPAKRPDKKRAAGVDTALRPPPRFSDAPQEAPPSRNELPPADAFGTGRAVDINATADSLRQLISELVLARQSPMVRVCCQFILIVRLMRASRNLAITTH